MTRTKASTAAYEKRARAQHHKCAICGKRQRERLARDHNHITGKSRALLCKSCNIGLGMFQDDPTLLREAAYYIEEWA